MKHKRVLKAAGWILSAGMVLITALTACSGAPGPGQSPAVPPASALLSSVPAPVSSTTSDPEPAADAAFRIYLYGEQHGEEKIYSKESELWEQYYKNESMRHLFVEVGYFTAEFLNLWMQSDSEEILDQLFNDWEGTLSHNPYMKEFYRTIKRNCPETVFHGTDIGHQYDTTGERYLQYLRDNGLENSEQYRAAEKNIEQGKYYYEHDEDTYRENMMVENFIEQYDRLNGESIMGIYGSAHTGLEALDYTGAIPCMANQLKDRYGEAIYSENLTWVLKVTTPQRTDTIELGGKAYKASYFGKEDLTGFKDYASREFWRLEQAYGDFKDMPKSGNVLPYDNYPMLIEKGQVFIIEYTKTDATVTRECYRSDGNEWEGRPTTEEFSVG